ncbi:MAG: SufD family Fe-S cluster assembly protein, partial [Bacteroidetes bacterium]|nr:SufD family Fe-S cluster assembly protein [Bacteroidota bacterium]
NSNELYKGILADLATGVFNGKIIVAQKAQKTNAFQSNRNLLLSNDANIYTKPQLEIFADDVKCSHGATSSQIEDSELFYLQARGIGKEMSRSLLTLAFAGEVLDKLSDRNKQFVEDKIFTTLGINI